MPSARSAFSATGSSRPFPLPGRDADLAASVRGKIVHRILASFYKEWCREGPRKVTGNSLLEALALMQETAATIMGSVPVRGPARKATIATLVGSPPVPGLLERFLKREAANDGMLFEPSLFEFSVGRPENDPVFLDQDGADPVQIRGVIDRVDMMTDGRCVITDYKVRATVPTRKSITEGTVPPSSPYISSQ